MAKHPESHKDEPKRNEGSTLAHREETEAKSVSLHDARSQPGIMSAASAEQAHNVGATEVASGAPFTAQAPATQPLPTPKHTLPAGEPPVGSDRVLTDIKRGDLVRLLEPHYDGYQRFEAGTVVRWWNDEPPNARNVTHADNPETPLTAPAMTDGKPPADYLDPTTGKKPVIGSV